MPRKKVELQRITNDAARRATFKKRMNGLMKKASELATLCAINICMVVYAEGEVQPMVWPSTTQAVPILGRFMDLPDLNRFKKTLNQEDYLRERITKLEEQLRKEERDTCEHETKVLLHDAILSRLPGLVGLTIQELTSLSSMVQTRLKSVKGRIEQLNGQRLMAQCQMFPKSLSSLQPRSNATGNMHMNSMLYETPQQEDWFTSGGDLGAVVCGAGTGGDMSQLSHMEGFSWDDAPGPSDPPN